MTKQKLKKNLTEAEREAFVKELGREAGRASRNKDYAEVRKVANQIVKLSPENQDAYFYLGVAAENGAKDFASAEKYYRRSIEINPNYYFGYFGLGSTLSNDDSRLNEAEENFLKAIEINPKDHYSYSRIGGLLIQDSSRLKEAEEYFSKAIKLNRNDAYSYCSLGALMAPDRNRWKDAELHYLKAIELFPSYYDAFLGLGFLYEIFPGYWKDAEKNYRKAIEILPKNPAAYLRLGFFYHKINMFDAAIESCQKAAMLDENNFLPLLIMASIYRNNGEAEESGKYSMLAKMVIEKDDFKEKEAEFYNLACLHSILKDKSNALKYLRLPCDNHPPFKIAAKDDPDLAFVRDDKRFTEICRDGDVS